MQVSTSHSIYGKIKRPRMLLIFIGECGCWKKTPHDIFLAWFSDVVDILTQNGIGYALWNFRGDFGIMDSGRTDVNYTDWYGHKLNSKLLDLLKKY